jgi:hypothetical protein
MKTSNRFELTRILFVFSLASILAAFSAFAQKQGYETPPVFKAGKLLDAKLQKGPHHEVQDEIKNNGYMNLYTISSDFGEFQVGGMRLLEKRVNEIYIIAKLKEIESSQVFMDASKKAGKDIATAPVRGAQKAYEIVSDPEKLKETAKSIPGGVSNLFKTASRAVKSGYQAIQGDDQKGQDESQSVKKSASAYDAASELGKEMSGYNKNLRKWQKAMGIDPYTRNEVLNNELDRIVKVETSVGFTSRLIPGVPSVPFIGKASGYINKAEQLGLYEDPQELKRRNIDSIAKFEGASEKTATAFIGHQWISPTMQTAIIDSLNSLAGVKNRGDYLDIAIKAESTEAAVFFMEASEILAWFHQKVDPIDELVEGVQLPAGVTKKGRLLVALPVDHMVWTEEVATIFRDFKDRVKKEHSVTKGEIHITGTASDRCKSELEKMGTPVFENVKTTQS